MAVAPTFRKVCKVGLGSPSKLITRMRILGERGATAVEYGLVVALIAAVIIVATTYFARESNETFDCTVGSIQAQVDRCS